LVDAGALWTRFSRSHARTATIALLGAGAAAAYAQLIGCETGTCPLTSSVWTASLYGAVVGGIAGWPVRPRRAPRA
jgi:hypothetical protein